MAAWLAFVLGACGAEVPQDVPGSCLSYSTEGPAILNIAATMADERAAMDLLRPTVGRDPCDVLRGISVTVLWVDNFDCPPFGSCLGEETPEGHIYLEWRGAQLVHELLHRLEQDRGVWNTFEHPDWTSKGFYALEDKYQYDPAFAPMTVGLDGGTGGPFGITPSR